MQLKNDRVLRAMRRQAVDVTPVWLMRQAGRYLPEYRAVREKAGSFMTLCKTPELACEVTLQPLARFPLDAAIIFSDILTIPDAMGLGLSFIEGEGPVLTRPVRTAQDIEQLIVPVPEETLGYVLDAIQMVQRELAGKVPLIGFCGSPWTLAAYMLEGKSDHPFPVIRKLLQEQPHLLQQLLEKLAEAVRLHLRAQVRAGVQAVMIFDTWGGILNTADYQNYSLAYMKKIIAALKAETVTAAVPMVLFTKAGGQWLELMAQSGCDVISVDWLIDLKEARQRTQGKVALQGNLDPAVLYQPEPVIREAAAKVLADYGEGEGHIFNLGHGILRDVPVEHVGVLVDAVHTLSKKYHLLS
jgi:uroporphyrinogen decarboxylase